MGKMYKHIHAGKCLLFFSFILFGYFNKAVAQRVNPVYLAKEDTTRNMYLLVSPPDSVKETGFMFLMPGFHTLNARTSG